MVSIVSQTKYALYNEKDCIITDFQWNSVREKNGYIILYNESTLEIYDQSTGERTLQITAFEDIRFTDDHLLIMQDGNWGMFEFSGKCIVPCEYDYIYKSIYSLTTHELIAVSVDTAYETGGYYIVAAQKYYEADDIHITKTNRIELFKDGEWVMLD